MNFIFSRLSKFSSFLIFKEIFLSSVLKLVLLSFSSFTISENFLEGSNHEIFIILGSSVGSHAQTDQNESTIDPIVCEEDVADADAGDIDTHKVDE
jgi:hypothetical protein